MSKQIISFGIFIILIFACDSGITKQAKPETVYPVTYIMKSNEWYIQQAKLWKEALDNDEQNPEAWYNYYKANRYANFENIASKEKQNLLNTIIEEMGRLVPDSYEYLYLKGRHTPNDQEYLRMDYMEKAYKLDPERTETYHAFIDYYDLHGNEEKETEFYNRLYKSKDIAPGLLNYNYNELMSTEKNAILFTNGDNDTYPAQMLQKVFHIRTDVAIINISMMKGINGYLEKRIGPKNINIDFNLLPPRKDDKFLPALCSYLVNNYPAVPVYFALTVYNQYTKDFKENLYVAGLASKYSEQRIDNVRLAKQNIENKFRLDYLQYEWYEENFLATNLLPNLNMNYIVSFTMLFEFYQSDNKYEEAGKWKKIVLDLADRSGKKDEIVKYMTEKGL